MSYTDQFDAQEGDGAYLLAAMTNPILNGHSNPRILFTKGIRSSLHSETPHLELINMHASGVEGMVFAKYHPGINNDLPPQHEVESLFLQALRTNAPMDVLAARGTDTPKIGKNTPRDKKTSVKKAYSEQTPKRKLAPKRRKLTFSIPKPGNLSFRSPRTARQSKDKVASTDRTKRRFRPDPAIPFLMAAMVSCWLFATLYSMQQRGVGRR